MPEYLFTFGYETPAQRVHNSPKGWGDEDSAAVWIGAEDEESALAWGRKVAAAFVHHLSEGASPAYDWALASFAHGIEADPANRFLASELDQLPHVQVGVYPDFAGWIV